jgi:DNA recombination protein RmuC
VRRRAAGRRADGRARRHLRAHVDRLADKAYWSRCRTARSSSCCSCPGEAFLAPALEHDPRCSSTPTPARPPRDADHAGVAAAHGAHAWQQEQLTENARAVVVAGKELYARLGTVGGHVDKLGRTLNTAVTDYNRTVASLERSVLPSARRMADLSGVPTSCAGPRRWRPCATPPSRPELTLVPAAGRAALRLGLHLVGRAEVDGRLGDDVRRGGARRSGGRPSAGGPPRGASSSGCAQVLPGVDGQLARRLLRQPGSAVRAVLATQSAS